MHTFAAILHKSQDISEQNMISLYFCLCENLHNILTFSMENCKLCCSEVNSSESEMISNYEFLLQLNINIFIKCSHLYISRKLWKKYEQQTTFIIHITLLSVYNRHVLHSCSSIACRVSCDATTILRLGNKCNSE